MTSKSGKKGAALIDNTIFRFEDGNLVQNLNETTSITYEAYRASGSSR